MKKIICILMCFVTSAMMFTGCDDNNNNSVPEKIEMEDLPYGYTLRNLNDAKIKICFDGRYFSDEAMTVLADYYYALQTQDLELFKKTQNADYIKYLEKNSGSTLKEYLSSIYNDDVQSIGEGLKYTYIEVTDAGDSKADTEINEISDLMDNIYTENGKTEKFSDTVKDAKYAALTVTAELDGKSYTNTESTVYVFECKEGTYIFN